MEYRAIRGNDGKLRLGVSLRGIDLVNDPLLNKGTAFTHEERRAFGLEALLPNRSMSLASQSKRIFAVISELPQPLQQYGELQQLQERNETLYYRVLTDNLEALMPVVYTPTVGLACRRFSKVFRRARGVWITPEHRGRIATVLRSAAKGRRIRLMVVTDNEAILGIGDQGAGGMAISIGKLALYTAGAGIHPADTLPVSLDVGTDNEELLKDELYLGWPHPRLRGEAYMQLVDEFVAAVKEVFPGALVQWEDFQKGNAVEILEKFRGVVPSFNDDIQGTGAVAWAGVLSAMRRAGTAAEDQRILIYGAGAAGLGIARQLRAGLKSMGVSQEVVAHAIGVIDSRGLLVADRAIADAYKNELAWSPAFAQRLGVKGGADLLSSIKAFRPNVLIGGSGQGGAFTEEIIREMAKHAAVPIVMPFSNPTDNCEAIPEDIIRWTEGRALVATGSPFAPVTYQGKKIHIGQGNNAFIFPGLGLGALIAGSRQVTDGMIAAAASALADTLTQADLDNGFLFPPIPRLREVSAIITRAVVLQSIKEGSSALNDQAAVDSLIRESVWTPEYPLYEPV